MLLFEGIDGDPLLAVDSFKFGESLLSLIGQVLLLLLLLGSKVKFGFQTELLPLVIIKNVSKLLHLVLVLFRLPQQLLLPALQFRLCRTR
jgi:hypothetical protein